MADFDAIVVGAGLLGASAAAALADDGRKVALLDARGPHHAEGSSHGHTRITRTLNFEADIFNHTAARTRRVMEEMEKADRKLIVPMKGLFIMEEGSKAQTDLTDFMLRARQPVTVLRAAEIARYGITVPDTQIALCDDGAATMDPFRLLDILCAQVSERGGLVRFGTEVTHWHRDDTGVRLTAADGVITARHIVLAAGGWTPELVRRGDLPDEVAAKLQRAMKLERVPLYYFDFPEGLPDFIPITVTRDGNADLYGMPEADEEGRRLLKVGFHGGRICNRPEAVERNVSAEEIQYATDYVARLFGRPLALRKTNVCLYAMMVDDDLPLVGPVPGAENVLLATYGGGICAKHCIALGEMVADFAAGREVRLYDSIFDITRRVV